MKKNIFFLVFALLVIQIFAKSSLVKIYHGDFGIIDRTVLQFNRKPEFTIKERSKNNLLVISLENCEQGSTIDNKQVFDSKVLEKLDVLVINNKLNIVITTDQNYVLKKSYITGQPYKIVLDIYNMEEPKSIIDRLSFAKFYQKVGFYSKAIEQYKIIEKKAPQNSGIHYFWGKILLQRKKQKEAIKHFKLVNQNTNEFRLAQEELNKLGFNKKLPQKKSDSKVVEKVKDKIEKKEVEEIKNAIEKPLDTSSTIETSAEINKDSQDLYKIYKDYFSIAESLENRQFLVGVVAAKFGDYENAISFLKLIPPNSTLEPSVYKELAEIYLELGDENNAKLYRSLIDTEKSANLIQEKTGFFQMKLRLWMALILALLFGVIVFFLLMIYYNRKTQQEDPEFIIADLNYHDDLIKKDYKKNEEITPSPSSKTEIEPTEKVKKSENKVSIDEEEVQEYTASNFEEKAPLVSESLTTNEEAEMLVDETKQLNPEESVENEVNKEENGFGNDEYKKKMIMRLFSDGWESEAIAKELRISQREVDFIIKMND